MAITFINLPGDFKIIYGIMADTVHPPGFSSSPRRGYLVYMSLIQGVLLLAVGLFKFNSSTWLVNLIMISGIASSFLNTVIAGFCTVQQRIDPINGAQDLQSWSSWWGTFASIGSAYLGGWLSQHNLGIYGFAGAGVISVF